MEKTSFYVIHLKLKKIQVIFYIGFITYNLANLLIISHTLIDS